MGPEDESETAEFAEMIRLFLHEMKNFFLAQTCGCTKTLDGPLE